MYASLQKYVGEVFNIISQQSTAKPGCIIELDTITEFVSTHTLLLNKFPFYCTLVIMSLMVDSQSKCVGSKKY